jgi:N-acetylglutamate synthase-like GNAT family acetyltransferase
MFNKYDEEQLMTITIEAARLADLHAVLALLERSGLPKEGLADHLATTLVARSGDEVVGSAALEVYGAAALLRSVAVDSMLRGEGLGYRLTRAALDLARHRGVATVYLLTETAGDFVPRFGFHPTERAAVDPAVQQSVEFRGACPTSAQVLVASLGVA